jgi:hypothetical protein
MQSGWKGELSKEVKTMNLMCNECGETLEEKTMKSLPDRTLYCPECFEELFDDENKNIIEKVYEAMSSDTDGNNTQAEILENEYMDATADQQKAIDRVFIALCGWSLKTLIEGQEATESYNPYK